MKRTFRKSCAVLHFVAALTVLQTTTYATTFTFNTDPFAGSTALTDPGRQIVTGETFITFNIASDVFAFDPAVFGVGALSFANGPAASLPTSGVNVVVLQEFPASLAAGGAATLIANQITAPGPGFFIYFNTGLNLARLVYSTDLNDATADLKILARMTNLSGQPGRDAFPTFTAANFQLLPVPESASYLTLFISAAAVVGANRVLRRKTSAVC